MHIIVYITVNYFFTISIMSISPFPVSEDDFALPVECHIVLPEMPIGQLPDPATRISSIAWKGEIYGEPSDDIAISHPAIQLMIGQL